MTLLELFGLLSILTSLGILIFKLYWENEKDRSSRLEKANEVLSDTLNNYIQSRITPTAMEIAVLKQEIARKYKVNVTLLDDVASGLCNAYIEFIAKHLQTAQFRYMFKTYGRRLEEDWIKIKFSWHELLRESYITAIALFVILLINSLSLGLKTDEEYYFMLLIWTGILAVISNLLLQPIFNHVNEKKRKEKAAASRAAIEFWCK